ncbi:DUF1631 family protein [Undibacterium oligocarboniphilum]|uniref:DUF1631 family protein n=1 Tax=Undibacterium oligocarboniphilum TaxID=666702 RepID=A0A850QEB1_9BURK|nr:DUF1631 family protein [Undibacterium oligocarboniphilum]MBC3869269.1 DUF1631 family protein [Undibacterium oligocarboniphilum]NVO77648.1 DUF1631 family protein [Undibacterium oligocarboniphilum]
MALTDILSSTRMAFFNAFERVASDIVPNAIESLYLKSDSDYPAGEKADVFNARLVLQERRDELFRLLGGNMQQLLDRSMQTAYQTFRPNSSPLSVSAQSLSLLDSSAFEDSLRFNSLTQLLRDAAGQELIDLNIRIAVLFSQDDIIERENPFRPYLLLRALSQSVEALRLNPEVTGILVTHLGQCLEEKVATIYQETNSALEKQGIHAQLTLKINKAPESINPVGQLAGEYRYGATSSAGYAPSAEMPAGSYTGGVSGAHFPPLEPVSAISMERLFQVLRNDWAAPGLKVSPQMPQPVAHAPSTLNWLPHAVSLRDQLAQMFFAESASAPVTGKSGEVDQVDQTVHGDQLIRTLGEMHKSQVPDCSQMLKDDEVRNLIYEQRTSLMALADSGKESMTIDMMAMLMASVLKDPLLTASLRTELGRLAYLLLQLALLEPDFLHQPEHPAQVLLNRISTVTIGAQHLPVFNLRLEEEITRIFKTLGRHDCSVPGLFERIDHRFETFVARELKSHNKQIRRVVKSIEEAQIRYAQFIQTATLLKGILSTRAVPDQFRNILENDWIRVIYMAERRDSALARRLRMFVPDILWSMLPKISPEDGTQLSVRLPQLLADLKLGMELLSWSQFKQNALLNWLNDAHGRALRTTERDMPAESLGDVRQAFREFLQQQPVMPPASLTEAEYAEMSVYLRDVLAKVGVEAILLDDGSPAEEMAGPIIGIAESVKLIPSPRVLPRSLVSGTPVIFNMPDLMGQGCINWVNPNNSNVVLSVKGQEVPVILSVPGFVALSQQGVVRLLETAPLFERAIHTLIRSAELLEK